MRKCPCGEEISPTLKTIEFGVRHGRDLTKWPGKCNRCLVDWAVGMFEAIEATGLPIAPAVLTPGCVLCSAPLGKNYYEDYPGVGDVCLLCWKTLRET